MTCQQKRARKGESAEIRSGGLMASWIYDEKFLTGMWFLFEMLPFRTGEDDDIEHPTQEQEEQYTMTIGFEFHRGLKNSATTFQAIIKATRYDKSDRPFGMTTDRDSIDDYPIFWISPCWDPDNEARRISMISVAMWE
jgi:hypothetical protein